MISSLRARLAASAARVSRPRVVGAVAGTGVATGAALYNSSVFASDGVLVPTLMPWDHGGYLTAYDAAAIRRGHQVYSQVCASCHGLRAIAYRNLVGVCYSEEEAKAMAEDVEFQDGPNDEGEMFERPGKLSDYFPSPYPNEEAARFANNGAYPPDLSLITKARPGGADYVFALLTGYKDPPAGLQPRDTQYYNPYFPGGWIGMPAPISEGAVEYEDGTSPTVTQMAKDVCVFLTWAAEPEADERKLMGFKLMTSLTVLFGFTWWYKRRTWSVIKNRRLVIV
jgi:ubiquinol-cytochrome c reductase cytochrome c1 subunit